MQLQRTNAKRWLTFHRSAVELHGQNPNIDKESFAATLAGTFGLAKARSVFHATDFAVRFSYSSDSGFSNCVVSLATLKQFDENPFLVCLLKPSGVSTFLANSSLIKKISHSSQKLTVDNIKGTILGHDINRELEHISNIPENFENLYELSTNYTWQENLERIVAATSSISATGKRFEPNASEIQYLLQAPLRSQELEQSGILRDTELTLQKTLAEKSNLVLEAAEIDNVNLRGNAIEQILTGAGNFHRLEDSVFDVAGKGRLLVDLKTKILELASNPKLYNVDKTLQRLADGVSVLSVFMIGIDRPNRRVVGRLVDILDASLIGSTRVQFHWAGRNSRGVTQLSDCQQFFGANFKRQIDVKKAQEFLNKLLLGS